MQSTLGLDYTAFCIFIEVENMCLESLAEILLLCYSLFLLIGRASRIYGKLFFNKPLVGQSASNLQKI